MVEFGSTGSGKSFQLLQKSSRCAMAPDVPGVKSPKLNKILFGLAGSTAMPRR